MQDATGKAENALVALTAILAEMGLQLKPAKTRIVHLREGGEGVDFLGFHHHWVRGHTAGSEHLAFLARWPSRQAMQHARHRVRELTARDRLHWPVEQVVGDLNRFLRGWAGYFRLRQLDSPFRPHRPTRGTAPTAVDRSQSPTAVALRAHSIRRPTRPLRTDQPERNYRRASS